MLNLLMLIASLSTISGQVSASNARYSPCDNELSIQSPQEAVVRGAGRLHLLALDDPSCKDGRKICVQSSYVRNGTRVLVSGRRNGYSCLFYFKGFETADSGYLPDSSLHVLIPKANSLQWQGRWRTPYAQLDISEKVDRIQISGKATRGPPAYDIADAEGEGRAKGNTLYIVSGAAGVCHLTIKVLRDFLVVRNEDECGGAGVTFAGIYKRSHRMLGVE